VPPALLPEVGASSAVYGEAREPAALAGVPVAGIVGDQQGALFGQACFHAGLAKTTYGTGCFLLLHTGGRPVPSVGGLLTTVAWRIGDDTEYALEGSVFVGGATIQWLRDGLGILRSAADVEALAREVEDDGGVVLVPAFTGLGAPVWDPKARGLLIGITRGTRRGHVARAALAGIAHQVADVLEVMRRDGGALEELRVDGGVVQNDLLLQLQADLLGLPIVRPAVTETTALGAAWLAGLATGVWRDRAALAARWREDRRFLPSLPPGETRRLRARWARALERSRDWAE
jgi:glycerol kinase